MKKNFKKHISVDYLIVVRILEEKQQNNDTDNDGQVHWNVEHWQFDTRAVKIMATVFKFVPTNHSGYCEVTAEWTSMKNVK